MRITSEVRSGIKESELLSFLFHFSVNNSFSIAVWQLPGKTVKHVVLSSNIRRISKEENIEDLEEGFLFAPFDRGTASLFVPADLKFRIDEGKITPAHDPTEDKSFEWLLQNYKVVDGNTAVYHSNKTRVPQQRDFVSLVNLSIEAIASGQMEKVVPSRTKTVRLPSEFDLTAAFLKLCSSYTQAFVSLVSSPESGTWMGATPEELVRIEDKTIFRTVALAGTQPYRVGMSLRNVAWTHKEIEEQALVERYIISCFKKIRLREYVEHGPKTIVAGNLMHLRSDFIVNMQETNFPQLGSTMLRLLHPTSAVCGMPLEAAEEFLNANEGYNREYYAGYLGPVNIQNQTDIFVNLRCMKLSEDQAILYAGAGVTIDSVPEHEWEETEMKMNTLLGVIQ